MESIVYQDVIRNAPFGYAYLEVISDSSEKLVDYRFIDINKSFEELIGLNAQNIIGKTLNEITPYIEKHDFNWVKCYGDVALTGISKEFEHFSLLLNRWYKVQAYSSKKGFLSTVFLDITEEKRVNNELETFFSLNLDLLCIADITGKFLKVNKEWESILGFPAEELQNSSFLDFVHPDDLAKTHEAIAELANQKKVVGFTNRYRTKGGAYRFIEWRSQPNGNLIFAAARDITNKIINERVIELRFSLIDSSKDHSLDELLQKAIDSTCDLLESPIGFFHFIEQDQKTISLQQWSTATKEVFCKIPGKGMVYSVEEAGVWAECILTRKPVIHNDYKALLHKKGLPNGHAEIIRELVVPVLRNGKIMAILGVGNKQVDYNLNDVELVSFIADVTWAIVEGKRKEETLTKLSQAMEQSPASIVITDLKGNIEYVNPKFTRLTGYSLAEALGKNPRILKSGITSDSVYEELWESIVAGKEWRGEFQNVKKDGECYWEFATISPVKNESGVVTHYIAVKEDITDRKASEEALMRSEAKLKELNSTKDKFFSIIGHDIKGVFNSILLISELLAKKTNAIDIKDIEEISAMLQETSRNGYALLDNLLNWSRIQTGRIKFNPTAFALCSVIESIITLYKPNLEEKGITIDLCIERDLEVVADRFMLETILRNLISNAIKFSQTGDRITVAVEKTKDCIKLSVADSGVGIEKENIPKLFEIETSYSTPGTNQEMGTGLGLILCKEFVHKHNGKIWAESELQKGTTMHFTIPILVV